MILASETDKKLRAFARHIDYSNGEDAYHNVIVSLLSKHCTTATEWYLKGAIKQAVKSIYTQDQREQRARQYRLLNWHPSDRYQTETCKRGHTLITRTTNKQRICLECKRLREGIRK